MNAVNRFDHRGRWKLLYKAPNNREWVVLGSVGSADQASRWQFRFFGSSNYRIEQPTKLPTGGPASGRN